jgi:membrane protein
MNALKVLQKNLTKNKFLILEAMSKMLNSLRTFIDFVTTRIWKIRLSKVDKRQGIILKQLRVIALAIKRFQLNNSLVSATALTYYTIFSIVPILALAFAIAQGFGFQNNLQEQILAKNKQYESILIKTFEYANSMLANTKGGVIAGIGIVLLLWSVMKLLISIESSFNLIWEVKRGRTWVRKITDYLTIMMVGPILLIVAGGISVALEAKIDNLSFLGSASTYIGHLIAYSLVTGAFTFLFVVMPNTKVSFKPALNAAIISTILFQLLGWAYIKFQIGANSLNAIYGGFAALPLFLIWMQYSWYIVLFGAELAYSAQFVDHYELEEDLNNLSIRYKKVIALMIANLVAKRFYNGESSLSAIQIAERLDIPARLAKSLVQEFEDIGVFVEVRIDNDTISVWQPAVTESKFTVQFIIDSIERKGVNSLPINDTIELIHINEFMAQMDKLMDTNAGHRLVKDIVK